MQTGNQIESQTESFSAMTVAFAQDAENLQSANHIFNFYPLACQFSIHLFFCICQLLQFAVFQRQNRFPAFALQSPISPISAHFQTFAKSHAAFLKQFVIVHFAFPEKRRNNLFRFFINQNLRFQRVSLFLSRIKPALFFFGRSIKLSVASIIVYLIESSASSRFLPGRENLPDLIKISSIRLTRRETFERVQIPIFP